MRRCTWIKPPDRSMLTAAHRLFFLRAQAVTAGQQSATLDLRLPSLSPFAALAGQQMHGDATIKGQLVRRPSDVSLKMDASVALSGNEPAWAAPLGERVALQLSGALSGEAVSIERLRLDAHALTLSLSGSATRQGGNIQARWELNVADLNRVAPELKGALQAAGRLSGTLASLTADANLTSTLSIRDSPSGTVSAELHARGLPSALNGTVQARGNIDGAPLELSVAMAHEPRGGMRATIQHADWKSAHLEGEIDLEPVISNSRGQVRMRLGQLGDLDRILGVNLKGSLEGSVGFTPVGGRAHAQFELDGRDLKVGQFSGALHMNGEGDPNAVAVQLSAQTPDLYGAPANLSSGAVLNLDAREIRLASAAVDYRGQTLKLLSPAVLSLANGWSIGPLKLGAQDAVLQIEGQLTPALDLHAALRQVKPALVDAFVPDLLAAGTIEGAAAAAGKSHGARRRADRHRQRPALGERRGRRPAGNRRALERNARGRGGVDRDARQFEWRLPALGLGQRSAARRRRRGFEDSRQTRYWPGQPAVRSTRYARDGAAHRGRRRDRQRNPRRKSTARSRSQAAIGAITHTE